MVFAADSIEAAILKAVEGAGGELLTTTTHLVEENLAVLGMTDQLTKDGYLEQTKTGVALTDVGRETLDSYKSK